MPLLGNCGNKPVSWSARPALVFTQLPDASAVHVPEQRFLVLPNAGKAKTIGWIETGRDKRDLWLPWPW
jgi:hypothetical protein